MGNFVLEEVGDRPAEALLAALRHELVEHEEGVIRPATRLWVELRGHDRKRLVDYALVRAVVQVLEEWGPDRVVDVLHVDRVPAAWMEREGVRTCLCPCRQDRAGWQTGEGRGGRGGTAV